MTEAVRAVPTTGCCRIHIPPTLVSIAISRSAVRRVTVFRDDDAESAFLVALTEIVANAIDEHVRLGMDESIALEIEFGASDVVRVIDSGAGLQARSGSTGNAPSADGPLERGRGLELARALVPAIEFDVTERGTTVTLPLAGFGIVR
ncbi:ATP-binding protein [Ilumatobacter coccineus]|uniref:ATP-binding protein n=1 Tax=Ilumatobacter coccineus TaxID=467094 RepID=UPI00059D21A6|nr:ATP-binding protein [Ilumatobacter coccineus]